MKLQNPISDDELRRLVFAALAGDLDDAATADLAQTLARSGPIIDLGARETADVASTGGPSSLSTVLCPLFLRAQGKIVPKLGIPGRPAGGIDTLGTVPGYQTELSSRKVLQVLETCGYAHFAAGARFAPLDTRLFRLRQELGAQGVEPLVIASLLSKKIAAGVLSFGIDVRVAKHGNFGSDFGEARLSANRFCRIARMLGLDAVCVLSEAGQPLQPYIGRGEALMALRNLFFGEASPWLQNHMDECAQIVQLVVGKHYQPNKGEIYEIFCENLSAQGASADAFEQRAYDISQARRLEIAANADGYVYFDLGAIRAILVEEQRKVALGQYSDPAGVILHRQSGKSVIKGQKIISLRAPVSAWKRFVVSIDKCFAVSNRSLPDHRKVEVVRE